VLPQQFHALLGLVAKIDGKAIGFSYATIGEYFIGEHDKIVTIIVLYVKSDDSHIKTFV
jgi:hypothetical protein